MMKSIIHNEDMTIVCIYESHYIEYTFIKEAEIT